MQKQKTVAKWLAIVLLCTVGIGSYLLYDALSSPSPSGEALNDGDTQKDAVVIEPQIETPPREPYYTTLPREAESISGITVSHVGGEGDDVFHKAIAVNDKLFVFFSSGSYEYDVKSPGLSLAVFENDSLISTCTYGEGDFYDCKLSANGITVAINSNDGAELILFDLDGKQKARCRLPSFTDGILHLKDRALWWFYVDNGALHSAQILGNMSVQKSAYFVETGDCEIKEVLPDGDGFSIIIGACNSPSNASASSSSDFVSAYSFKPYDGFKLLFTYAQLRFRNILSVGGEDGINLILHGESTSPVLISFDKDFKQTAMKTLNGCTVGSAFAVSEGLVFVGDGLTISLCRHLDVLSANENGLCFEKVVAKCQNKMSFLAEENGVFSLVNCENLTPKIAAEFMGCTAAQMLSSADGVRLLYSSFDADGFNRASFGGADTFSLLIPSLLTIDT